jgi:hypothetical protein
MPLNYHSRHHQPLPVSSYESIQSKCSSFPPVVCPKNEDHIFDCGLKSDRPDDTGKTTNDQELIDGPVLYDGIEHIKWRSTDVSVDDPKCNDQTCGRYPV